MVDSYEFSIERQPCVIQPGGGWCDGTARRPEQISVEVDRDFSTYPLFERMDLCLMCFPAACQPQESEQCQGVFHGFLA